MVIIGVDPHLDSHTAATLDINGKVLASITVENTDAGCEKLLHWAEASQERK